MVPTKEAHLPKAALRSARVTAPILLALGAMNAWDAQTKADYAALSTALCLCVCAAGLFGEDLVQRGHRQDLGVLAHIAAHPGAEARGIARAVGAPERVVAHNLSRLIEDGLVLLIEDDVYPALRSYRLTS
ncbi:winged helix-turn-helix transcriptional regulator [Streptomyces sp. NPDC102282]|uniref:winged helix-turn-helix transcriptional regulator n=1 Tax=Streptomyces sp. NPDC102282 TaxID=3366154 RepID=UPI0037F8FFD4